MASTQTETRTRSGRCATHGDVTAIKSVPPVRFPFVVWLVRRWIALAQPYRCPTCAAKVSISAAERRDESAHRHASGG